MKHYLMSKKILSKISYDIGFVKYIRYGEAMAVVMKSYDFSTNDEYLSMLEDVFEAFTEAIFRSVRIGGGRMGTAYEITYNIIFNMLGSIVLPLDYQIYFDAKTRLKEIFDEKKWPFGDAVKQDPSGKMRFRYEAYPLGDQTPTPSNKVVFPYGEGKNKNEAIQHAAEIAITELSKYNIKEKIPDPLSKKNK